MCTSLCILNDCNFLYLGARGLEGEVGRPGLPGFTTPSGFLLVRHSQSQELPKCPDGANEIWNGYSLLYIEGNERSQHQDLGKYNRYSNRQCIVVYINVKDLNIKI